MGRHDKALLAFIESLPTEKLEALPTSTGRTIFYDQNYRLDMQGVSSLISGLCPYTALLISAIPIDDLRQSSVS